MLGFDLFPCFAVDISPYTDKTGWHLKLVLFNVSYGRLFFICLHFLWWSPYSQESAAWQWEVKVLLLLVKSPYTEKSCKIIIPLTLASKAWLNKIPSRDWWVGIKGHGIISEWVQQVGIRFSITLSHCSVKYIVYFRYP